MLFGKIVDAKGTQHLPGLLLHLLLHLRQPGLGLLEAATQHGLHDRRLHGRVLLPHFRRKALGLLGKPGLRVNQGLDVFFQIATQKALHGVAIKTDQTLQHRRCEHGGTTGLGFQNDLQQNAARQVVARLRIQHFEGFTFHHQVLHLRQGDVGGRRRVIEPAIRVFLDDAMGCLRLGGFVFHIGSILSIQARIFKGYAPFGQCRIITDTGINPARAVGRLFFFPEGCLSFKVVH